VHPTREKEGLGIRSPPLDLRLDRRPFVFYGDAQVNIGETPESDGYRGVVLPREGRTAINNRFWGCGVLVGLGCNLPSIGVPAGRPRSTRRYAPV